MGGLSTTASLSKLTMSGCSPMRLCRFSSSGASKPFKVSRKFGQAARERAKVVRSRGLAVFNAMRAVMRSMSPIPLSISASKSCRLLSIRAAIALWRPWIISRSRNGLCSHRRSKRLPMAVAVWSRVPSRVSSVRPDGW